MKLSGRKWRTRTVERMRLMRAKITETHFA